MAEVTGEVNRAKSFDALTNDEKLRYLRQTRRAMPAYLGAIDSGFPTFCRVGTARRPLDCVRSEVDCHENQMRTLSQLYRHSLALLTDLYELTMAYGYWKLGMADRQAVFNLTFRHNPFDSGFSISCGLHDVIDYLQHLRFDAEDAEYLASLRGNDGKPLFERGFLDYLRKLEFACD